MYEFADQGAYSFAEPDRPRELPGRSAVRAAQAAESGPGGQDHAQDLLRGGGGAVRTVGEAAVAGSEPHAEHGAQGADGGGDGAARGGARGAGGRLRGATPSPDGVHGPRSPQALAGQGSLGARTRSGAARRGLARARPRRRQALARALPRAHATPHPRGPTRRQDTVRALLPSALPNLRKVSLHVPHLSLQTREYATYFARGHKHFCLRTVKPAHRKPKALSLVNLNSRTLIIIAWLKV